MKPLFDEKTISEKAEHYSLLEAENKAISLKNLAKPEDFLICCDTSVVYENIIFGKPSDENDAKKTLRFLSNKTHKVITGYVILHNGKMTKGEVISYVTFEDLTDEKIDEYVSKCYVLDKAGSYGVQYNDIVRVVKKIDGSLTNVIGFPVDEIKEDLIKLKAI